MQTLEEPRLLQAGPSGEIRASYRLAAILFLVALVPASTYIVVHGRWLLLALQVIVGCIVSYYFFQVRIGLGRFFLALQPLVVIFSVVDVVRHWPDHSHIFGALLSLGGVTWVSLLLWPQPNRARRIAAVGVSCITFAVSTLRDLGILG